MRIVFRNREVLHVVSATTTVDKKIANSEKENIVETYHFSRDQFNEAQHKTTMQDFFSKDGEVCMDCPFAVSNGAKLSACHTHKDMPYSGFLSQLGSIGEQYKSFDDIPEFHDLMNVQILTMCLDSHVQFGTYGDPSLLPIDLVERMCNFAKSWIGYTHQWRNNDEFTPFFMALVHSDYDKAVANLIGYRSVLVPPETFCDWVSEDIFFKR